METTFREGFEKLGGHCPVCGNSDYKNIVVGTKKLRTMFYQMLFHCLDCGTEISEESGKACFAHISKTTDLITKEPRHSAQIEFRDLGSFLMIEEPWKGEVKSVMKVLTAWNIPLLGPPPASGFGNE
ncbi:MAG: hypothetical protein WC788_08845 [Candidatus Paceibacterota bacterium]|jgi:hypothetical protein